MVLSSVFLWFFVAVSLILCFAMWRFWDVYEYGFETGLRTVFGAAVLLSIASGLPLSLLLQRIAPRLVLGKVKAFSVPRKEFADSFNALAREIGVPSAELRLSQGNIPISFAIQSDKPIVVLSESLLSLLKKDEVEAVMAHELAHVKNSDTTLKAMVTAYKTALPHDPIVRLAEAAFHREREMLADEMAAKVTKRPLSLASALLRIYEAFPKDSFASHGTLSILGAGSSLMSRHPPILQRVNHLIHLADTPVGES
jgi:Zn-dependent protease with chaperone function